MVNFDPIFTTCGDAKILAELANTGPRKRCSMMRVVGSAEPPGGKPTMKRIGFDGYWASAEPLQSSRTSASAAFETLFMALPPGATLILSTVTSSTRQFL